MDKVYFRTGANGECCDGLKWRKEVFHHAKEISSGADHEFKVYSDMNLALLVKYNLGDSVWECEGNIIRKNKLTSVCYSLKTIKEIYPWWHNYSSEICLEFLRLLFKAILPIHLTKNSKDIGRAKKILKLMSKVLELIYANNYIKAISTRHCIGTIGYDIERDVEKKKISSKSLACGKVIRFIAQVYKGARPERDICAYLPSFIHQKIKNDIDCELLAKKAIRNSINGHSKPRDANKILHPIT